MRPLRWYTGPGFGGTRQDWKHLGRDWEFFALLVMQGLFGPVSILLNQSPPLILREVSAWWSHLYQTDVLPLRYREDESLNPEYAANWLRVVLDGHRRQIRLPSKAAELTSNWTTMFRVHGLENAVGAFETGGWKGLQVWCLMSLQERLRTPKFIRNLLADGTYDSLFFEAFGFVVSRCQQGDHWYVSDDKRRKDCIAHRLAGQQARWRRRHPAWKLRDNPSAHRPLRANTRDREVAEVHDHVAVEGPVRRQE